MNSARFPAVHMNILILRTRFPALEECISMDVCKDQSINTIINYPNGVVPDFENLYSIWKLLFPYDIMPDII